MKTSDNDGRSATVVELLAPAVFGVMVNAGLLFCIYKIFGEYSYWVWIVTLPLSCLVASLGFKNSVEIKGQSLGISVGYLCGLQIFLIFSLGFLYILIMLVNYGLVKIGVLG